MNIGSIIVTKRKELGLTQQGLADKLHVSFQAVSKWEKGSSCPEIDLLPVIADVLHTSVDTLLGYEFKTHGYYDDRYKKDEYFWGLQPNETCYEIMKLKPPTRPLKVLDIGCGEGKDAVFFARNGYQVTAFDLSLDGIEKGKRLAEQTGTHVDFFQADLNDYRLQDNYDIIFSSGVFDYMKPDLRVNIIEHLKEHTAEDGINAIKVFVDKPFIEVSDKKKKAYRYSWKSGEIFTYYHDWVISSMDEVIYDCNSGGVPHKHCIDIMISNKPMNNNAMFF